MRKFYNYLEIIFDQSEKEFALITIIDVEGSAYKHEGSKMLVDYNGQLYGTVSAGCLEEDLKYYAKEVIENKTSNVVVYDLRSTDDLDWGVGAGCNGAVTLLIEYVDRQERWHDIFNELNKGNKVVQAKEIQNDKVIDTNIMVYNGKFFEESYSLNSMLKDFIQYNDTQLPKLLNENGRLIFIEMYEAKDRLYIFGAGPDVKPLIRNLIHLDFYVNIIDPREAYNNGHHMADVHERYLLHPHIFLEKHRIEPNSHVLIMTHNFEWDKKALHILRNHPPKYLGVLGPKHRTRRLLGSDDIPEWIHSPIGLDIGAEGEEEISISIISELIQVRNTKQQLATVL